MARASRTSQPDMFAPQGDLFGAKPVEAPRGPNPQMVRNRLHYEIKRLQDAEVFPFEEAFRRLMLKIIPEMAEVLPEAERSELLGAYWREWDRLDPARLQSEASA